MPSRPDRSYLSGVAVRAAEVRIELRRRAEDSAALRALTRICPGACFRFGAGDRIEFRPDSCTHCGTCRTVCKGTGEIAWVAVTRSATAIAKPA